MPLQVSERELEAVATAVENLPHGASVGELLARSGLGLPRRTLQRRLERLVVMGRLASRGEGRGCRYVPTSPPRRPAARLAEDPALYAPDQDWLSPDGAKTRALITRPAGQRPPVAYRAAFLASYEPNRSAYLPREMRDRLARIGRVGFSDLPAGTYLRQVLDRLLIDLSWNSSRLEGNTYSLLETQRLLEQGVGAEGRVTEETQMILNHKAAIEMLAEQAGEIGFNRYTICNLHALLADNLLQDPGAGGRLRSRPVGITGTVYQPLQVPQQIEDYFEEILRKAEEIEDPFEQSFFSMVHLPYLQPFEDVNKRVSRLAANIPLVRANLCPLSFTDVPRKEYLHALIAVYELNRIDYLRDLFEWAYRRSAARYSDVRETLGQPDPFRLRHRGEIGRTVREVVQAGMDKQAAAKWITREAAAGIDPEDRERFVEVVEIELSSLHEGNFARFRIRPSEFAAWAAGWR